MPFMNVKIIESDFVLVIKAIELFYLVTLEEKFASKLVKNQ